MGEVVVIICLCSCTRQKGKQSETVPIYFTNYLDKLSSKTAFSCIQGIYKDTNHPRVCLAVANPLIW